MKSQHKPDEAMRVAVEIATREAQEMRDIATRIKQKQHFSPQGLADLLQRVCHLVGLTPDPQLISMESATDEAAVNVKRKL